MLNKLFNIKAGAGMISLRLIFFIFLSTVTFSQSKTNLQLFYESVDSVVDSISKELNFTKQPVQLNLNLGVEYSLFSNSIYNSLQENRINYSENRNSGLSEIVVNIVLEKCEVDYGEPFKDGLFGSYFLQRNIRLSGNYSVRDFDFRLKRFSILKSDTVAVDEIKKIENPSFPFTEGKVPEESFFSGITEPLIAVGSAAIAVILFFSIRSK
jgi:hypothetical protein